MKGRIVHFKQNRHTTTGNQMIVEVEGVSTREEASKLADKKVTYKTKNGEINGVVASAHGNSGKLRVRFEKGMPGQALTQEVDIN